MLMSWGNEASTESGSDMLSLMGEFVVQGVVTSFFMKQLVLNNFSKFVKSITKTGKVPQRPLSSTEGDLGTLEVLLQQNDAFLYMLSFLEAKDFHPLFLVSRKMNYYVSHDYVWKRLFERENKQISSKELIATMTWKDLYKKIHTWKWDMKNRGAPIELSEDCLTASRNEHQGSNPAVFATHPFTRLKDSCEIEIKTRGAWIGIGLADRAFKVANASTLGTQSNCVNSAFFCQDSTLLQMYGTKENVFVAKKLENNDRIRIRVDFDENAIYYYRNGVFEGKLVSKLSLKEEQIYPCVNLSFKSVVAFINS